MKRVMAVIAIALTVSACGPEQPKWAQVGGCDSSSDQTVHQNCTFSSFSIGLRNRDILTGVDFDSVKGRTITVSGSTFMRLNMSGADLSGMWLYANDFFDMNLSSADFRDSTISLSNLNRSDFTSANFQGATFRRSIATAVNLTSANLRGAWLNGTDFTQASFVGADLRDSLFSQGTIFGGADFTDADLTGATFRPLSLLDEESATYCRTTMPDGTLNNRDC
jgi:uncharacterized protein YjbI with pentapeptide repeats